MIDWVTEEIRLRRPVEGSKSKTPLMEHLKQVWKATGEKPEELEKHGDIPSTLSYLWVYTLSFKPGTLSWQEILAWSSYVGMKLRSWEVTTMMALDDRRA